MNTLSKKIASEILKAIKKPGPSGISPNSFLPESLEVGAGFHKSTMYEIGGCIIINWHLPGMDYEEEYEFEPDIRPRNWNETLAETKKHLSERIEDPWNE